MKNNLKQCSSCGNDVAKSAKICPHCGKSLKMGKFLKFIILIFIISVVGVVLSPSKEEKAKKRISTIENLKNAGVSDLSPDGELALIFNMGSKYTDLQRDIKEKEIKGKVVIWKLKVYEVDKDGKNYKIRTRLDDNINIVGTSITIYPKNEEERKYIENLKTGDSIRIKGKVKGVILRYIRIDPAILTEEEIHGHVSQRRVSQRYLDPEKNDEPEEDYEAYENRKSNENIKKSHAEHDLVKNKETSQENKQYYTAQELNDLGYEYYKKKDYKNAYKYWKITTQKYPKFAMGHYNLACAINILFDKMGCMISETPELNNLYSKNQAIEHLGLSIKYRKDRWKRMQKDSDLKSLYPSFGYQKLLGANLKSTKNIQKFLTRIEWRGVYDNNFPLVDDYSTINFFGNIKENYGSFEYENVKRNKFNGKYKLKGNHIKLFANDKIFIGKIKSNGNLIFKDFGKFSDSIDPICSD